MTQVLLLGDSLVASNNWQTRLGSCRVTNLAMPGVMTSDVFSSLDDVKVEQPYADLIMLMVGTNDILTGNYEFIHTLRKICVRLCKNYPSAEILITSIFPMVLPHLPYNTISSLNCHIEALTMQTGCCYLDIHSRLKDSPVTIFQEDGVHVTEKTYEIWSRSLLEHIAFLIEDD
ncbi:MAG: lysophospholipase L1-like esterase [Desulforhopalus sp.]|jgi:lysophospholipase L1-like esterase